MSKLTSQGAPRAIRTSSAARVVARLLDRPDLTPLVRELAPPVVVQLIERVGLEDLGEIVALLTPEQLEGVFDVDLWRTEAGGQDEAFDGGRFGLWLAVLWQAGEAAAVAQVAAMDEDLLALGLASVVWVVDLDELAQQVSEDPSGEHDQLDKALESSLHEELERFRIIARAPAYFDDVVALLAALDRDHHDLVERLLSHLATVTTHVAEESGGLVELLSEGERLESDVAAARADRRERDGFVAPSDAAAFLRLARVTRAEEIVKATRRDPLTAAHFRALPSAPAPRLPSARVAELLRDVGALPPPRRMPARAGSVPLFSRAMAALRDIAPSVFAERVVELAYLVNVLVAAGGGPARVSPEVAADVVVAVAGLGLCRAGPLSGDAAAREQAEALSRIDAVKAFRVGWHEVGDEPFSVEVFRAAAARAESAAPR